jgi:hypothetical protein
MLILIQDLIASSASAQFEGDLELLKMTAVKYRANRENLKTWKGDVSWQQIQTTGIAEWTANYACDFTLPAKRWSIVIENNIHVKDGKEYSTPILWHYGMFREGAYYDLLFSADSKDNRHLLPVQDHPFSVPGSTCEVFDPEYFFTFENNNVDEILLKLSNNADKATGYSIKKEGDTVIIQLARKKDNPIPNALYYIDLSKGANLTQVEMRTIEINLLTETIWRWSWQEINGVWVPKEITKDNICSLPEPEECHNRIVWKNTEVNVPLASDEFSLQKLGIRQGDVLFDTRTNTKTIITDKSFPTEAQVKKKTSNQEQTVIQRRSGFGGSYFTIISITVLLILAIIMLIRFVFRARRS